MDWTSKEMAGLMNLKELEQLFGVNEDKSRQAASMCCHNCMNCSRDSPSIQADSVLLALMFSVHV